jgi:predicted nucleic acid-binding protein
MARLIDSSVFIELERRGGTLSDLAAAVGDEPFALASITASELLVGVHRSDSPQRRLRRLNYVETVFREVPILSFDLEIARIHARLRAEQAAMRQPIGANDLLIAATALTYGYAMLTDNLRDFQRVPGLVVQRPEW